MHLLALLTPVHSLNLLVNLLREQKAWRQFAQLPHRHRVPDVRMLHEFRVQVGVSGARLINEVLLEALLQSLRGETSVAVMDATDLEAACSGSKKKHRKVFGRSRCQRNPHLQERAEHVVCRLQKAQFATVAFAL